MDITDHFIQPEILHLDTFKSEKMGRGEPNLLKLIANLPTSSGPP